MAIYAHKEPNAPLFESIMKYREAWVQILPGEKKKAKLSVAEPHGILH